MLLLRVFMWLVWFVWLCGVIRCGCCGSMILFVLLVFGMIFVRMIRGCGLRVVCCLRLFRFVRWWC